jgi:hypothetical protein
MARTIRYATHDRAAETGPTMQSRRGPGDQKQLDVDGYLERLAKYVPAEVLAGFTPLAALTASDPGQLTFVAIVFVILTPVYLYITRVIQPSEAPTKFRRIMYVLGPVAFLVWAINTSEAFRALVAGNSFIKGIVNLDASFASVLLVLGALIIPAIDIIVDYELAKREQS